MEETVELTFNEKAAGTVDIVMVLEFHNIVPPKMEEYWLNKYTEEETKFLASLENRLSNP